LYIHGENDNRELKSHINHFLSIFVMTHDKNGKRIKKGDTVIIRVNVHDVNELSQDALISVKLPHQNGIGSLNLYVEPNAVEVVPEQLISESPKIDS